MRTFKHLTKTQRNQLESLLKANVTKKEISRVLGVHLSTIYREIRRGEYQHKIAQYDMYGFKGYKLVTRYSSDKSENLYRENLKNKGADIKLGNDFAYAEFLERMIIEKHYSPKATLMYIKRNALYFDTTISVNTFYKYIAKGYFLRLALKHLPEKGKKKPRAKRDVVIKKAPKGISIEKRPLEILERKTFGHWEMDCVCGPTRNVLLVLTERLTRKEIIMQLRDQTANSVVKALNRIEYRYGKDFKKVFRSITVDNGSEFSDVKGLEKSIYNGQRTTFYYCHPYCSCERGTNERINREIRRLIPKGTDLGIYNENDIQKVEDWLNTYPRKVLNYYSSNEIFERELRNIA